MSGCVCRPNKNKQAFYAAMIAFFWAGSVVPVYAGGFYLGSELGVDYALTESLQLGIKGRWVDFDSFKDDGVVWDPLRGHPPPVSARQSRSLSPAETGNL